MARIWTWGFRNPLLAVAALALAAGAGDIIPWGLSLTATLVAAVGASLANRLSRRGRARQRRAEAARHVLEEAARLRERSARERKSRRAA